MVDPQREILAEGPPQGSLENLLAVLEVREAGAGGDSGDGERAGCGEVVAELLAAPDEIVVASQRHPWCELQAQPGSERDRVRV